MAVTPPLQSHVHKPLDRGAREVRVAFVDPKLKGDIVQCRLQKVSIKGLGGKTAGK